jgi:zinc transport system ATP-binding protein
MRHSNLQNALEVDQLSVRFGENKVLSNLSFTVPQGSSLAVIGPNGAGKTVLFRALIGAIDFEGEVRWAAGARIGYVPQKLDLDRNVPITGIDFLRARTALARKHAIDFSRALHLVGVPLEIARQPIGTMSGGQFQRLLIAFALAGDPNVLLLDEPTAGIDERGQERLNELVRRLQEDQGLTVLFISHELSVVYRYASNVLCLGAERGCFGPPRMVLTPDMLQEIYGMQVDYHVHDR